MLLISCSNKRFSKKPQHFQWVDPFVTNSCIRYRVCYDFQWYIMKYLARALWHETLYFLCHTNESTQWMRHKPSAKWEGLEEFWHIYRNFPALWLVIFLRHYRHYGGGVNSLIRCIPFSFLPGQAEWRLRGSQKSAWIHYLQQWTRLSQKMSGKLDIWRKKGRVRLASECPRLVKLGPLVKMKETAISYNPNLNQCSCDKTIKWTINRS